MFHLLQITGDKYPQKMQKLIEEAHGPLELAQNQLDIWNNYELEYQNYIRDEALWVLPDG